MSEVKKILICGNYGSGNVGDELILKQLIARYKADNPEVEISVLSSNPQNTEKLHSVKAYPHFPSGFRSLFNFIFVDRSAILALKNCDIFVLGGGGLFSSLTLRANIIWLVQLFFANFFRKPVHIIAQSFEPYPNKIIQNLIAKSFNKAQKLSVRDSLSKKSLVDIGVSKGIEVVKDPVFSIASNPINTSDEVLICPRYLPGVFGSEHFLAIANFCNWLIVEKKKRVLLMDFQRGTFEGDETASKLILSHCKADYLDTNFTDSPENMEVLLTHFNSASFIFGMRLHSQILAIALNKPFIGVRYSKKVAALLKDVNKESCALDINELTLENLKSRYLSQID